MPDDPTPDLDGLDALAPSIDLDAASRTFRSLRRRRDRRRIALASAAIVALVVVAASRHIPTAGDRPDGVASGPERSATSTADPPPGGERRVTTREQGLVLEVDLPVEATVGERMWLDVTLRNERSEAITMGTVAPCGEPVSALAGSIDAVDAVEADTGVGAFAASPQAGQGAQGQQWAGDLAQLPGVLGGGQAPKVLAGRPAASLSTTTMVCTSMEVPPPLLDPGASVTRRIAIDLRWARQTSANGSEPAGWVVADDEPDDADDEHAASSSRTAPMTAARVRLM